MQIDERVFSFPFIKTAADQVGNCINALGLPASLFRTDENDER